MGKNTLLSISCRVVGPGGTTVDFYPTNGGLKAIWHNENCPYTPCNEETYEAEDGSNVTHIPWDNLSKLLGVMPPSGGSPRLQPQPKKGGKRK